MTSHSVGFVPSLTVLLLCLLVPSLALAVPTQLNHQGRLLDSAGLPVQGELPVTFTLEDAEEAGNVLWSETLDVDFSDGYYSVKLGSSGDNVIDAALLAEASLWIGLTIDGGDQLSPLRRVVSAPYAVLADSAVNVRGGLVEASEVVVGGEVVIDTSGNWIGGGDFAAGDHSHGDAGVPLGTIIDWWRPSPVVALPVGYQICDGSTVDDVESPWFGYALPDLVGRVALGASEEEVGVTGGSAEHGHSVDVVPHDHGIDHDHGGLTGTTEETGAFLTDGSNSPTTGSAGALDTSGADTTTVTSTGAAQTGGSNTSSTSNDGGGLTSASSDPITALGGAPFTGYPTNSTTSEITGGTAGSSAAQTSSGGNASTGSSSSASTGTGSGSTGSASSSSTSSAGTHNHKTFRWDNSLRRWKHYNSSGSEDVLMDYLPSEGNIIATLGEDMAAIGVRITVGDKTSYTNEEGSHSHVNSHTHTAGSHGHNMSHTHNGPSHSHQNEHSHAVDAHDHTNVHQHGVPTHDHDSDHNHLALGHDHSMNHDHDMAGHNHELAHSHTGAAHEHDASHDHDIDEHLHTAGSLSAAPYAGFTGAAAGAGTATTSAGSNLPPYVGLLKLMRIR